MDLTRRDFMKIVGVAALGTAVGNAFTIKEHALAADKNKYRANRSQVPGYFRLKLGSAVEITALCDGFCIVSPAFFKDFTSLTEEELDNLLNRDFVSRTKEGVAMAVINAFLVNTGEHLVLVDAGKGYVDGEIFLEKHGLLTRFLRDAGYTPKDIDVILPTHLHADHICGVEENGKCVFPNATIYLAEEEKRYWLDSDISSLSKTQQFAAEIARTALKPYLDAKRVKVFAPGDEVFPHVKSVPLFGHTPGHTGYMISSGEQNLFIWGDLLHIKSIQLPHPEVGIVFDTDAAEACKTRAAMLPKLAEKKQLVCGAHLPFPGIGYLEKLGENYHFHPVEYQIYH